MFLAGVAHPVERHLAKVEVASSSLVTRSIKRSRCECICFFFCFAVTKARTIKCGADERRWRGLVAAAP